MGLLGRLANTLQQLYDGGSTVRVRPGRPIFIKRDYANTTLLDMLTVRNSSGTNRLRVYGRDNWIGVALLNAANVLRSFTLSGRYIAFGTAVSSQMAMALVSGALQFRHGSGGLNLVHLDEPATPAAGDTPLRLLWHNGTYWNGPSRVATKDGGTLAAGDKVLVLV